MSLASAEKDAIAREAPVFRIQNVLKLSGDAVLFDEITVPAPLFQDLDEGTFQNRDGTIYGLYQSRYAITVTRISERISAAHPPAKAAEVLGITTETPALVINRVAYTYGDTPVEYRVSWVDTERHAYLSDLWRNQTVGRA